MRAISKLETFNAVLTQFLLFAVLLGTFAGASLGQKIDRRQILAKTGEEAPKASAEPETGCIGTEIITTGNSATDGSKGNIRTFSSGAFSVKASAFSRRLSDGVWETAFLGAYGSGLGVTDNGEGSGANDTHRVDNVGSRLNYVMFEFNQPVVVDQVYLDAVLNDSDITVWIGNANDPFNNHLSLSDALLGSFGPSADNDTSSSAARWANINASNTVGNVLVVAASVTDTTPEDWFKIRKLQVNCRPPSTARVEIIKEVGTLDGSNASVASFDFDATGLGTSTFSLVDNNVTGPDRFINNGITSFGELHPITVTERQPFGWSLVDLVCKESGTQNSTIDFAARSVTIIAEPGESIVCTFTNGQASPSAATANISGRAVTADTTTGISGAILTLLDAQTGETRTVRTNQFGYYSFNDIDVDKFYVLTISHRRYSFSQATRAFTLRENLMDENFIQTY